MENAFDSEFWAIVVAIVVLLMLSALFSASETALTAASRPRMHQLEQEGDHRARRVNRLREQKERMISALLFANNIVNILSSALATSVLIDFFGDSGVVYATIVMTVLIVIFSEVAPKTYALNDPDNTSLRVARVVDNLVRVLGPVTLTAEVVVLQLLRSLRGGRELIPTDSSEAELRGAIDLHRKEETEEEVREERAMLRSILDLTDVAVSQVMSHRRNLVTIDARTDPSQVVDAVLDARFTRLPVWQDNPDNVVGVINAKALLREVRARDGRLEGLDLLEIAAKPWFVPDTTTLFDQLQAFRQRREHFALVIDEYGALMGVVTLEDILEDIVGDIHDEHDVTVQGVCAEPGGTYVVDGTVTIRDLNREFEWRLPDHKASTIAGLVINEARLIPSVGQVFTFYEFRFEVLSRVRHQVTSLRITPPTADEDGSGRRQAGGSDASVK